MKAFRISFISTAVKLSTVLGAVENEVDDIKVEQIEVADTPSGGGRKHYHPEVKTPEAIMKDFPTIGGQVSFSQLQATMTRYGFAKTSASPAMSDLCKKGVFEKIGKRDWRRLK